MVDEYVQFKQENLKRLLVAIVSEPDKVEEIIKKYPQLLLERLEEKDMMTAPSGQKFNNATAYRTALAVEDTQMAEKIRNVLVEIAYVEEANEQHKAQFYLNYKIGFYIFFHLLQYVPFWNALN